MLSRRRRSAHLFCCFVPPVFVQARKRDRQDRLPSPVSLSGGLGIRQELYNPRKAPPMPRARMEFACNRGFLQPFRSHLSLAFASATVCHCMSEGSSLPPQATSLMRSCNCPHPFPVVDFPCLRAFHVTDHSHAVHPRRDGRSGSDLHGRPSAGRPAARSNKLPFKFGGLHGLIKTTWQERRLDSF